ncbi:MAG TPA: HepT-like ribonuclease domain-containing protein, partial [Candidatus Dormibacteraeota bacterium]|nr:HepT-like ribonuclease domain-containing protein [Candidatus Dormibacteraeota bacterium]
MTELDAQLARRKLATITRNLTLLARVEGLTIAEYQGDPMRQKGTERLLQEIVEAAADVNVHLLHV